MCLIGKEPDLTLKWSYPFALWEQLANNIFTSRTTSLSLEANVKAIGSDIRGLQSHHQMQQEQFRQAENQRSSSQEAISREVSNQSISLCQVKQRLERAHDQRIDHQEITMRELLKRSQTSQVLLQESVTNIYKSQQRLEFKLDIVMAAQIANTAEREVRRSVTSATSSMGSSQQPAPMLPTQIIAPRTGEIFTSGCTCICHRRNAQRTPECLQDFFGNLFFGYSGIPIITPACDKADCLARSDPMLLVTYVFPTWLLARIFIFVARLSLSHGLELNIRLPRVIHPSAHVWSYSAVGDVESMKELFRGRVVTPYDIDGRSGYTALIVRLQSSNLQVSDAWD